MKVVYQIGIVLSSVFLLSACSNTEQEDVSSEEVFEGFFAGINTGAEESLEDLTFHIEILNDDNVVEEFKADTEESANYYTNLYEVSSEDPEEIDIEVLSTEISETDEDTYSYYMEEFNQDRLVEGKINDVETVIGSTQMIPRGEENGIIMDWEFTMVNYDNEWYMTDFVQDVDSVRDMDS